MIGEAMFDMLLEPSYIGHVKTRNRMVKTGAGMALCDVNESGYVTEKEKIFYDAIARGGVGLIIVGSCCVDYPLGTIQPSQLHIEDDKYIPSYTELTQIIHKHGCPTFLQLMHAGAWHQSQFSGLQPVSSSSVSESELRGLGTEFRLKPARELILPEIEEIVDKFVRAAERAQKAGFDGVVINGATCHLINSFLSRFWNRRQDGYGCGDLKSRARFVVEIIREIKKHLGQDFPVTVLFNVAEFGIDRGTTIVEGQGFARILQEAGADALEARDFGYGDYNNVNWPEAVFYPEPPKSLVKDLDWSHRGAGAQVPMAAAVKKAVSIPVITEGWLNPELGESILRRGHADFIGFTRRLIADPDLPNKVASGRLEDIAPCTACRTCLGSGYAQPLRCRVNAAVGGEREYSLKQADKKKNVVVVGGGPAGMEAARVAALRGHEVILYERESKLGGLLPLAALVKGLEIEDLMALSRYLKTQLTKLGVKIRLGKEFNLSVIEEIKPDVVILATGGKATVPEIPGINRRNVVSSPNLHNKLKIYLRFLGPKALRWLTRFWMPIGKNVVVIGGGIQGCQLAAFLVKRSRKVTILDTARELGEGLVPAVKSPLLRWLAKKGVTMMTEVKYEDITDNGLTIATKERRRQIIEADTIVPAIPLTPNTELFKSLEGRVTEVYAIGDCREPRLIIDAIADGWSIGRTI